MLIYGLRQDVFNALPILEKKKLINKIDRELSDEDKKAEALVIHIVEECKKQGFSVRAVDTLIRKLGVELDSARFRLDNSMF